MAYDAAVGVVGFATLGVVGVLALLLAAEFWWPARRFEAVPGWRLRCVLFIPMIVAISSGVPALLEGLFARRHLLHGHELGVAGGAVLGIFLSEFVLYWVHRWHHSVNLLWRWVHQLHHSAERMDVFGAAYFHPFEILEGSFLGIVFFGGVLGLEPEAAALAILWQSFHGIFQHGNIGTPRWLGYIIQRPEQHGIHHQRELHAGNYSNLPIFDRIFGTFENPRSWQGVAGFYAGSSACLAPMLLGRDISNKDDSSHS